MPDRGGKRRRKRTGGYPDLTSFSDIAFLLIIYFILATSFHQPVGLQTDVPAGRKAKQAQEADKTIMLHPDSLFYGEKAVSIDQLREALLDLDLPGREAGGRVVQLEAKPGVQWQEYYEVLAAIRGAGGEPGIVMEAGGEGP